MDNLDPHPDRDPQTWTVEFVAHAGYDLSVYCTGACRSGRTVDLLALSAAGRAKQRIADLPFRCDRCGAKGAPLVSWWSAGYSSWDYERQLLKGCLPERR